LARNGVSAPAGLDPPGDCALCPRLAAFRTANRTAEPTWHNAPVPAFAPPEATAVRLLVVGLAPGLRGANRTGRPFTGDYAGQLLYPTLLKFGFAHGTYGEARDDGLTLTGCRITNAVRCVPPANKPTPAEAKACRPFLEREIAALPALRVVLALGAIAHAAALAALALRKSAYPFRHGATYRLDPRDLTLAASYHCSRYNVNTGKLTAAMFEAVVGAIAADLGRRPDRVSGPKTFPIPSVKDHTREGS
jgi:uracil-DNA glycosylase family 4